MRVKMTDLCSWKRNGCLVDAAELNIEDQSRVWWNHRWWTFLTICSMWWACDTTLTADFHIGYTDVPTSDHITTAQLKLETFARFRAVEHFVVRFQSTFVVNLNTFAGFGFWTLTNANVFDDYALGKWFLLLLVWLLLLLVGVFLLLLLWLFFFLCLDCFSIGQTILFRRLV